MKKTSIFDVLIVYTNGIASSASSKQIEIENPFSIAKNREHYSEAYSYFLKKCDEIGLRAAFATTKDIVGPGKCKTYWIFKDKRWQKKNEFGFAPIIFDKFSSTKKSLRTKRIMLFFDNLSIPFNNPQLSVLFNDKLKTFNKFKNFAIPTVIVTEKNVDKALLKLKKITSNEKINFDFTEDYVLKDRFGSGGIDIFLIDKNPFEKILKIIKSMPDTSFVLQPFARFDKGYVNQKNTGFADIRIIISRGKIIQQYIRTAKEKDFRCNEHQGGKVRYISQRSVPECIIKATCELVKIIDKNNSLYALDFLITNKGKAYLVEGNINPGIYWGKDSQEDKINTKKLIRKIVADISLRKEEGRIVMEKSQTNYKVMKKFKTALPVVINNFYAKQKTDSSFL